MPAPSTSTFASFARPRSSKSERAGGANALLSRAPAATGRAPPSRRARRPAPPTAAMPCRNSRLVSAHAARTLRRRLSDVAGWSGAHAGIRQSREGSVGRTELNAVALCIGAVAGGRLVPGLAGTRRLRRPRRRRARAALTRATRGARRSPSTCAQLSSLRRSSRRPTSTFFDHGGSVGKHVYVGAHRRRKLPGRRSHRRRPRPDGTRSSSRPRAAPARSSTRTSRCAGSGSATCSSSGCSRARATRGGERRRDRPVRRRRPRRSRSGSARGRARGAACTSSTSSSAATAARSRSSRRRTRSATRCSRSATSAATGGSSTSPTRPSRRELSELGDHPRQRHPGRRDDEADREPVRGRRRLRRLLRPQRPGRPATG